MQLKNTSRSRLESVVLIVVFAAIFVFLLNSVVMEKKVCRERELISELSQLRSGLALYLAMERVMPDNLVQLCTARYRLPGDGMNRAFVEMQDIRVNDRGEVLDPFKNPYRYDKNRLSITTTTEGFQGW